MPMCVILLQETVTSSIRSTHLGVFEKFEHRWEQDQTCDDEEKIDVLHHLKPEWVRFVLSMEHVEYYRLAKSNGWNWMVLFVFALRFDL